MSKILCITSGLTGILNASFELVNRLEADGHSVTYASSKLVAPKVNLQGITYKQLPEIRTDYTSGIPAYKGRLRKVYRWLYKIKNSKTLEREALLEVSSPHFAALVASEKPELLIIDIELHEYIITAYKFEVPTLILSQWFSLWRSAGLPYLLHNTIPGKGWTGSKMGINIQWQKVRVQRWWTFLKKKIMSGGVDRRSILRKYAKKVGFPMSYISDNFWPGPFTYSEFPVIAMVAQEMEFPHSKRANLEYIGPMIAEKRIDSLDDQTISTRISDIIQSKKDKNAKLIYCSVSTLHQGDFEFIERLIQAVSTNRKWMLIISMGGLIGDDRFDNLPDHVFPFSYIPQLQVLADADLSINHGGIHTINECIYYRVPMLVYSGKRSDQNGCAARIEYHKLGIMADKDTDSTDDIKNKIQMMFNSFEYQDNIDNLHAQCEKYQKSRTLETIVSKIINQPKALDHNISI